MGLGSVMTTALSALTAAEAKIDVLGNNLANSQSIGFKEADVIYSTQFFQTLNQGSGPSEFNGGTNPSQFGLGVRVAGIATKHTQGIISISSSQTHLAIQGGGMFIVQGSGGEQLYTRAGAFSTNGNNELVTQTGQRLLGYSVDEDYNLQTTGLKPLSIPIGMATVAQATTGVALEGGLPPNGTYADTATVVQSQPMSLSYIPRADNQNLTVLPSDPPSVATVVVNHSDGGGSHPEGVTYGYRFVFVDSAGTESSVSTNLTATTPVGNALADNVIQLNGLPAQPSSYQFMRVYRTAANGSEYFRLTDLAPGSTTFTDNNSIALSTTVLNQDTLSAGHIYRVTYSASGSTETRPSTLIGPVGVTNGRIQLDNLPTPPIPGPGDRFPLFDTVHIYRSSPSDPETFYLVHSGAPGQSFTDNRLDVDIMDLSNSANRKLDMDGPPIESSTLLSEVVVRDGDNYIPAFGVGELSLNFRKGGDVGKTLTQTLNVTPLTRVSDLLLFMQQSMGIATFNGVNDIPPSLNKIQGESGTLSAGVTVVDGAIRIVSNNGTVNGISIPTAGIGVTNNSSTMSSNLSFKKLQDGNGTAASTEFLAYDSLGIPIQVRVSIVRESQDQNSTVYRWYAESPDNDPATGYNTQVGTGRIEMDGMGRLKNVTNSTVVIDRASSPAASLSFELDWGSINGLAADTAMIRVAKQDGTAAGTLSSFTINQDGSISGVFSNGTVRPLGQIMLGVFANQEGLTQSGDSMYANGLNSGVALRKPGEGAGGELVSGALELSNVDVGRNLIDLGLASTLYRGNSRVLSTAQQLLDELLNLRR